jgi:hypothetical protein
MKIQEGTSVIHNQQGYVFHSENESTFTIETIPCDYKKFSLTLSKDTWIFRRFTPWDSTFVTYRK